MPLLIARTMQTIIVHFVQTDFYQLRKKLLVLLLFIIFLKKETSLWLKRQEYTTRPRSQLTVEICSDCFSKRVRQNMQKVLKHGRRNM